MDANANAFFLKMVTEAAAIATSGRWDAVNKRIAFLTQNPGSGNEWWVQLFGGLCCQTFSEYLELKRAYQERKHGDVPLLAWRVRNLLELSVWATYCAKSRENARSLYEDAGRDARDVFDVFINWGTATAQDMDWMKPIQDGKQDLSRRALADGVDSLEGRYREVRDAAVECGIGKQFSVSYKVLSKFAHPTAMRILGTPDEARESLQTEVFFSNGCLFFLGAFNALESQLLYRRATA